MRILLSCVAGSDQHLFCLLPLARAAEAAGDDVVVVSGPDRAEQVARHGLAFLAAGHDFNALVRAARERAPDLRLGGEHEESAMFTQFFADLAAPPAAVDLLRIVDEWAPDLVVHEPAELAAPLVATARGVPYATHDWGLPIPPDLTAAVAYAVAPMWRVHGLDAPVRGGLYEQTHIQIRPESLGDRAITSPAPVVQQLRPVAAEDPLDHYPRPWAEPSPGQPIVHVCLGSAGFNQAFELLRFVVDAVAHEDVRVVVTVGRGNDPAAVGVPKPNVHVETYIPHGWLMAHCDAVVTHGGSGTVLAALQHGVPMLVLPLGADQYRMADAVAGRGAGMTLRGRVTQTHVRRAVRDLLDDPRYRRCAASVAKEIESMPSAADALTAIRTRLAIRQRRPQ